MHAIRRGKKFYGDVDADSYDITHSWRCWPRYSMRLARMPRWVGLMIAVVVVTVVFFIAARRNSLRDSAEKARLRSFAALDGDRITAAVAAYALELETTPSSAAASSPPRWSRALLYAYVENPECAANFNFLLAYGRWDLWNSSTLLVVVVNGYDASITLPAHPSFIIVRRENVGYDFGAHAAGLAHVTAVAAAAGSAPPSEYGFLNCGMSGPFLPAYATDADWFGAYTSRLSPSVRLVGAYVTCLDENDLGGQGPHVEGHSFFTDLAGVRFFQAVGVLRAHPDKLSAILDGEWAMSRAVFAAGHTIDTLLYRYQGIDWRAPGNSNCNKHRFAGHAGGYGGGEINPFETIFFKRLWRTVPPPSDGRAVNKASTVRWVETAHLMAWRAGWAGGTGASAEADRFSPRPPTPYVSDSYDSMIIEIDRRLGPRT